MRLKISNNQIKVKDLELPAIGTIPTIVVVREVRKICKYDSDKKPTDVVEAIRYTA